MEKIKLNDNKIQLIYKLLIDFLILFLISFFLLLIGETILPGIISSRIDFAVLTIILTGLLLIISFLGKKLNPEFLKKEEKAEAKRKKHSKLFYATLIIVLILLIISAIKFKIPFLVIIIISTFLILYSLNKNFLE